ncbi:class IV adenylate cyclase [Frankia sp. CNm7]|uniref:Class IV adenylate cyclase n=1 Tax=Frankia nepalensis TaxID=1836974 RepID=A0A937UR76_9ACTN|nr:class IV adenylate cyclase [Frankia nepalensis]MBL7499787.1 class IV adenylate cyclase [Frankia nepalensis]MBL7512272.1 class IV adenylate cyclase [Frankia nepalensis]MBL7520443.1 class IV adenylate cyclase [Frankia nepalensis]MBL7632579.1 class IV adenylate cyclase [Frankia nepalensis]
MREVEVKYSVADVDAVIAALRAWGVHFGEAVYQDDQAFAPVGWSFGGSKLGVSFLRLRTVDGRHWFALKQPGVNAQDCLEYETEVLDRRQMHEAILRMGYWATVRVAKSRRTGRHGDVALCLDEVEGVGTFLELERMVPDGEPAAAVQDELAAFVTSLGIEAVRTAETYDSLVRAAQEGAVRVPSSRASTDAASAAVTSSAV